MDPEQKKDRPTEDALDKKMIRLREIAGAPVAILMPGTTRYNDFVHELTGSSPKQRGHLLDGALEIIRNMKDGFLARFSKR
jgi:hypothetical protein